MKGVKTVDAFIADQKDWIPLLRKLRKIIIKSGLEETIKWGAPVYAMKGKNIVGMGAFKSYAGLWFFQGALLSDPKKKLINAQEGKTKALRQWRFTSEKEIDEKLILNYIEEAKANSEKGKEIKADRNKVLSVPEELTKAFGKNKSLKNAFEGMSLSCKREYAEYIGEAKRPETRERRLEKIVPMILESKGLNDRYR